MLEEDSKIKSFLEKLKNESDDIEVAIAKPELSKLKSI